MPQNVKKRKGIKSVKQKSDQKHVYLAKESNLLELPNHYSLAPIAILQAQWYHLALRFHFHGWEIFLWNLRHTTGRRARSWVSLGMVGEITSEKETNGSAMLVR